ncbi:MAG: RNA methyltransferase [Bacilli bacterium]|nr:RNA methyltransferase [Bacilli bacterium]
MIITSLENNKIKDLVKLQNKKYRDITNTYLVETYHLVEEAYKAGLVKEIFLLEGEDVSFDVPITYVSTEVMKKITTTDTFTNIVALCEKNNSNEIIGNKILLLDNIQDPGNLGTIIRSSVAFNVDTIILSPNTVDLYNSKVLRSSQGMFCHINIITMDLVEAINTIKSRNITVYGTNVNDGVDVRSISDTSSYALVMGNEGNGVSLDIQNMCDKNLYIKMSNNTESLNVGVACSILLYELER